MVHLTQKRPKIADEGVLEPPKPPKNKGTYDILYLPYMIEHMLYILYHISYSGPRQAPTDNGYKLQQKSGRRGTILQPLSEVKVRCSRGVGEV